MKLSCLRRSFQEICLMFSFWVVCLFPANGWAEGFSILPFDRDLTAYIQDYHMHPDPQEALDYFFTIDMERFENAAAEHNEPHGRGILMAFYANVLGENPDQVLPFTQRLIKESTRDQAAFGTELVAYGAAEHRKEALDMIKKRYNLSPEYTARLEGLDVLPYPVLTATDWQALDVLWACYFATRQDLYIEKIAEPLAYWEVPDDALKDKLRYFEQLNPAPGTVEYTEWMATITAQAAMMGLTANAMEYPAVFEALVTLSEQRQDRVGQLARRIVSGIRKMESQ